METIFLDRNISEIQKKLSVPTFPPQTCHFCNKPITKLSGQVSESLCNHHISYEPEVVVISHLGCHTRVQEKLKESHRKAWILRRKKCPPNGIKPKEVE